ncbi:hypothetical protein Gotri_021746 [Gossypium trilobum]|uniref:Uncharacterized protein n=1 Tax=Gossypium trilobum TaxID=34281 RepID=A0A7J9DDR5_9ROSI|nr:hypothetical protein [Gossypium trilobum]
MSLLGYVIGLTTSGGISVLVLSFSELHMHMMGESDLKLPIIWSFIEVSDQNFVDKELREKTSCVSGAKRLKMMLMLDASSNGQVRLKILTLCLLQKLNCLRRCLETSNLLSMKLLFRFRR